MAKLTKQLMVYDPVALGARDPHGDDRGARLLLDCLDRETSCLDLQMLGDAADSSPKCEVTFKITIDPIKRRRGWR